MHKIIIFILICTCVVGCADADKDTTSTENSDLEATEIAKNVNVMAGEKLFMDNCSPCHAKSLDDKLTGPSLGCIEIGEHKRSREWLVKFTKNAQKMMFKSKDRLALCNWENYRPTVMTDFEHLSDAQINQIYDYINHESLKRNLCDKGLVNGRLICD